MPKLKGPRVEFIRIVRCRAKWKFATGEKGFLAAGIPERNAIGMTKDRGFEARRLRAFCKRVCLTSLFRSQDQVADSRCLH